MPTVKVVINGASVELTATEASVSELGKQAMDMLRDASAIDASLARPAMGFGRGDERRHTRDHRDVGYAGGFAPVHAGGGA